VSTGDQFGKDLKESIENDIHARIQRKMERMEERKERWRHRSPATGLVIGSIIVLVGLALLLDNMGIVQFHDVWRYWPVFLIIYGVSRILDGQTVSSYVWGGAVALIGAFILLDNLDIVVFNFDLIWPMLVIAFGLSMLVRAMDRKRYLAGVPVSGEPVLNVVAIFSGSKRAVASQDFRGGEIVAVFGGVRLDLTRAAMTLDRAVLDINAVFGGVEIRVPENWSVHMKGAGIFGGFDDKTIHPKTDPNVKTPELVITGASVFGGTSVTN
jgi:predicted membrane protein